MNFEVATQITAPKENVWEVISNIENCVSVISAISELEVLEKPASGLVGLKWRETRTMFGKQAEETMWITDAVEGDYYQTRAESHGAVYISRLSLLENEPVTTLTMAFTGHAQTLLAKCMSALMMPFFKGATIKALQKDLEDIKKAVEGGMAAATR